MDGESPRRYAFSGHVLDLDRCRLDGPDGRPLILTGRAFDVLAHLVQHSDRVVGKGELIAAAWPHVVVEENNLSQAISTIRRVLRDSRDVPQFVLTVPGRGYRFVADVQPLRLVATAEEAIADLADDGRERAGRTATSGGGSTPAARPRWTRRRLLVGAVAACGVAAVGGAIAWRSLAPGAALRSLAVLPFQPVDPAAANPPLERGIAETLVNRLGDLPGLAVAPSSSTRRAFEERGDALATGRELGVAAILEGQLQADEDRIRLTARLLDVSTGRTLWTGRFDERMTSLLDVQDALAGRLLESLHVKLSPVLRARVDKRYTSDPEAWRLYLNGRYQWDQKNGGSLRRAIEFFEAAQARDPSFALAAAGLSDAWSRLAVYGIAPPGSVLPQASRSAARAVALDPGIAEVQGAYGHVLAQHDRNWAAAERHLRRTLELRPSYTHGHLLVAYTLLYRHRLDEALAHVERARTLEPAWITAATALGLVLYMRREYAAAEEHLGALLAASPEAGIARRYLARVHLMRGEGEAALQLLESAVAPAPGGFSDLGRAYAAAGRLADAEREIAKLESLAARGFGVGYDLCLVEVALGRRERALAALERGVADQSQLIGMLRAEPALDALRAEPRYLAVARSLGLDA
jgi:DNA-binding winged helix-turn-helix (wHTH) protein/TolB-like protein/Flp pilus assembly protein TadD